MLLGGAVVLGVLCFVGANYYLRSYLTDAETKLAGAYKTRQVIVAKVEVPAGGTLSAENLAVRTIPERYLASTALEPAALDMVDGQKIMVALKPGDPIDRGALERGDRAALSTTVAKGERAITFPVDEISSMSGMLVPGDIIDLVYTGSGVTANSYKLPLDTDGRPKPLIHVRMILQAVPVMATGKITQKRVVRTEGGGQHEVDVNFSTVTLNVSPPQAEQVLMAQKMGSLTAVLRNPDDKAVLAKTVLDESAFSNIATRPAGNGRHGRYIEMIIGGNGTPERMQTEESGGPLAAILRSAMGQQAPKASAPAGAEKPAPSAGDVRSRLGINPSVVSAANTPPSTKQ